MEQRVHSLHEFVDVAERASKVLAICRKVFDVFEFDQKLRFGILLPIEASEAMLQNYMRAPALMPGVEWYESNGMRIFNVRSESGGLLSGKAVYLITT